MRQKKLRSKKIRLSAYKKSIWDCVYDFIKLNLEK